MTADLDAAKYMSFTSTKRDGTAVPTAVWLVPFEGGYAFTTDADAWKVKRVRNNPDVTVAVSDIRGRVAPGTPVHRGRAEVLDAAAADRVQAAIRRKYRIAYTLMIAPGILWQRLRGSRTATGAIKVTLVG
ncbi:MAG: PPOX class F420-dependent oxidoreductase [Ilumatobacteraceae bacterium]